MTSWLNTLGNDSEDHVLVFSLNVWGLPGFLSKEKRQRITAIADFLNSKNYDIVCLQELWCESDYTLLQSECAETLPYSHYYYSGVFGSGLCTFSKWPILKSCFNSWPVNGYVHNLHHGDWFGGKGVGLAQILKNNSVINVYNLHFIAQYSKDDCYYVHRVIQAFETGLFINLTSSSADLSIVCGDLNSPPSDIVVRLVTEVAGLEDTYNSSNNQKRHCGTCLCRSNSFHSHVLEEDRDGVRIDYIMYKGYRTKVNVAKYDLPLSSRISLSNVSFSDHEGVEALLTTTRKDSTDPIINESADPAVLSEAILLCDKGVHDVQYNSRFYLITIILLTVLSLVSSHMELHLVHILTLPIWVYCLFMATLWHKLEMNGVIGAKNRMSTLYK